jgi:hypothetical protein
LFSSSRYLPAYLHSRYVQFWSLKVRPREPFSEQSTVQIRRLGRYVVQSDHPLQDSCTRAVWHYQNHGSYGDTD